MGLVVYGSLLIVLSVIVIHQKDHAGKMRKRGFFDFVASWEEAILTIPIRHSNTGYLNESEGGIWVEREFNPPS